LLTSILPFAWLWISCAFKNLDRFYAYALSEAAHAMRPFEASLSAALGT
jgi:hypothetical protein